MRLNDVGMLEKNQLAARYRERGVVFVPEVQLPNCFEPARADFVFVESGIQCEVFVGADVVYRGADATWQACLAHGHALRHTRLLGAVQGDLFSGWNFAVKMLERAGGEFIDEEETAGVDGASVDGERGEAATSVPPSRGWLIDLTARAPEEVSPLVGRESELKQLKTCLLRKNKGSVVVLGMPGVGKTSFVLELARQIAQDQNVPPGIRGTAVYDVPLGRLRDSARGMADIERVGREMLTKPGRPLFFLDEIHQLVDPVFQPLRELLKPPLANGSLRVIGATTPIEWHQVRDQAFKRRFVELVLREPSPSDAVEMVKAWVAALASHHELDISEAVVREAVMLAARYLPSRQFPDKAIDLLDQAASLQRMSEAGHDAAVGDSDAGT